MRFGPSSVNLREVSILLKTSIRQIMYFGASGGLIFCTNIAVTALCRELIGIPVSFAYLCGFLTAMFVSFMLCRHVIFDAALGDIRRQFLMFLVSSIFFRGLEYLAVIAVYEMLRLHYLLVLASIQTMSFILKFFYYRGMVFAKLPSSRM